MTEPHLHSIDELADGRHHVIPCPVPGHEGERDSPGLDVRYPPKAAGRLPIGRQWLLRCWGDRCPYGSIVQAGARWAGFIPVTWYRAGREPELDTDSAGSSDWSPVRGRQVAFWPRERGDSLDEMLRAAHMALDAGAIGMWTIRSDPVEELPWPDVLDTLRSTIQTPGPPPKTGVELPLRARRGLVARAIELLLPR